MTSGNHSRCNAINVHRIQVQHLTFISCPPRSEHWHAFWYTQCGWSWSVRNYALPQVISCSSLGASSSQHLYQVQMSMDMAWDTVKLVLQCSGIAEFPLGIQYRPSRSRVLIFFIAAKGRRLLAINDYRLQPFSDRYSGFSKKKLIRRTSGKRR